MDGEDDLMLKQKNPFQIPDTDMFVLRQRERERKEQARQTINRMKIWEKPVSAGRSLS